MVVVENAVRLYAVPVPQREVARPRVAGMINHIVGVRDAIVELQRFRRSVRHAYFDGNSSPGRTIAELFNLFVLDEDRIRPQPVSTSHRAVQQLRVAHLAEVRLGVGEHRSLLPPLRLVLKHADESILCGHGIGKRIPFQRPGMPLAPEAVHERVHILHVGMPVVRVRQ